MTRVQSADLYLSDDGKQLVVTLVREDGQYVQATIKVDAVTAWLPYAQLPGDVKTTLARRKSDGP
jgi:hypothetical protein